MNAFTSVRPRAVTKKNNPTFGEVPQHIVDYVRANYGDRTFSQLKWSLKLGTYFVTHIPSDKGGGVHTRKMFIVDRVEAEIKLGRKLKSSERLDKTEENGILVVNRYENAAKPVEVLPQECPMCHTLFVPTYWQRRTYKYNHRAGPFCTRACSDKYKRHLKAGGAELPYVPIRLKEDIHSLEHYFKHLH